MKSARRLFSRQNWPVLDVSRRSIEETAAAILHLYVKSVKRELNAEISDETAPMIKWSLSGQPLILASASPTRARMLDAAKLLFEIVPADIDEEPSNIVRCKMGFLLKTL